jgi:hypothetical protein
MEAVEFAEAVDFVAALEDVGACADDAVDPDVGVVELPSSRLQAAAAAARRARASSPRTRDPRAIHRCITRRSRVPS